ncbi:helix-turn-helix transcriptional regulator [Pseudoduganella namucuonensis]|uniref:Transcriptional regulator, AraC family n=1 Tax=Pseudoduganella namucuonensis TaxID=1035707 RepID=A0A1I7LRT6_9BURK|nr:AraC family transcriptional regulator [Pseudoduganella namucuonensis]SFV12383.1 transcriptional regulator, AraC family [Pseudoduganella namucuonensis]
MAREERLDGSQTMGITGERGDRIMLMTRGRVAYIGLLGRPQTREFGSLTVYVSLSAPFQIQIGDRPWESAEMYVVAPDTQHRITTSDRMIGVLLLETETVALAALPRWLQPSLDANQCVPGLERVRGAFRALCGKQVSIATAQGNFDGYFLGRELASRKLDARMAAVVDRIGQDPCGLIGAEECAKMVDLSFSRFLHLFREEVGTTFRSFRAWKRARSFLWYVNTASSLTDVALDIGYPDSSHFSHTVRRYWGLTPKDILAGSRRLAVICHDAAPVAAA